MHNNRIPALKQRNINSSECCVVPGPGRFTFALYKYRDTIQ